MLDPSRREPDRPPRLARTAAVCGASGKLCPAERATELLEAIIEPDLLRQRPSRSVRSTPKRHRGCFPLQAVA